MDDPLITEPDDENEWIDHDRQKIFNLSFLLEVNTEMYRSANHEINLSANFPNGRPKSNFRPFEKPQALLIENKIADQYKGYIKFKCSDNVNEPGLLSVSKSYNKIYVNIIGSPKFTINNDNLNISTNEAPLHFIITAYATRQLLHAIRFEKNEEEKTFKGYLMKRYTLREGKIFIKYRVCVPIENTPHECHYDFDEDSRRWICRNGKGHNHPDCKCQILIPKSVMQNLEDFLFTFIEVRLHSGDHLFENCFFSRDERYWNRDLNLHIEEKLYRENRI